MTNQDPRQALQAAGVEFQAARASLDTARENLVPRIVEALKAEIPQKDVVQLSGYTRERVRIIARQNGIESEGPGPRRRPTS